MNPIDIQLRHFKNQIARLEAKDNLLRYLQLMMPDPDHPGVAEKTRYVTTPQAVLLCQIMEKVEKGELKRVAVSIGPQLGKSDILSRAFPAWGSARDPYRHFMLGSYNQDMADGFGADVQTKIESETHKAIFPKHRLTRSSVRALETPEGGKLAFVGAGGSGTGKPADFFVVDDPIKGDEDAQSQLYRDKVWKWFTSVVFTRCHSNSGIVVVHTRWNMDDLIGRLCDPNHPERHKLYEGVADGWIYINLPAVVTDPALAEKLGLKLETPTDPKVVKQFGAKPMSALWPERKGLPLLAEAKRYDQHGFNSLYMGNPSAEDGDYFKVDGLVEYDAVDLPDDLAKYGASDHGVGTKARNDPSVIGCVGVCKNDIVWVMPDVVIDRMETDRTVEEIIQQIKIHHPQWWKMESELISKSFGPFLKARMIKEKAFTALDPVVPHNDKKTRARSIQGRISLKQVRFPRFAPWWPDMRAQLLSFPYGAHDDFVDWLAHIGQGVNQQFGPSQPIVNRDGSNIIKVGSIDWMMRQTKLRAERDKRKSASQGY